MKAPQAIIAHPGRRQTINDDLRAAGRNRRRNVVVFRAHRLVHMSARHIDAVREHTAGTGADDLASLAPSAPFGPSPGLVWPIGSPNRAA